MNASAPCTFDPGNGWQAAHVSLNVNGRPVNIWTTHLDVDSAGNRIYEADVMLQCAWAWPEAHVIAGDFNMQPGSTEYNVMAAAYSDAWLDASELGATTNYAGNCDGCTRNSRIDYVFLSRDQSFMTVRSARIYDTRDSNGYMPSDHKPLLVTFDVR